MVDCHASLRTGVQILRTHKIPDTVAYLSIPSAPLSTRQWKVDPGQLSEVCKAASLAYSSKSEKAFLKQGIRWGSNTEIILWPPHACHSTWTNAFTHTNTRITRCTDTFSDTWGTSTCTITEVILKWISYSCFSPIVLVQMVQNPKTFKDWHPSTLRKSHTWPHLTGHSQNAGALKILYTNHL